MTGWGEVGLAFVQVVQGAQAGGQGGLSWSSDEATYPADLERVGNAIDMTVVAAEFVSEIDWYVMPGQRMNFGPSRTIFAITGSFSHSYDELTANNRVMADTRFVVSHTSLDAGSDAALSLYANALATPEGDADDPRIRWECTGRFDPVTAYPGTFDIEYRLVLEQDQHGSVHLIHHDFPHTSSLDGFHGGATLTDSDQWGPSIEVKWAGPGFLAPLEDE